MLLGFSRCRCSCSLRTLHFFVRLRVVANVTSCGCSCVIRLQLQLLVALFGFSWRLRLSGSAAGFISLPLQLLFATLHQFVRLRVVANATVCSCSCVVWLQQLLLGACHPTPTRCTLSTCTKASACARFWTCPGHGSLPLLAGRADGRTNSCVRGLAFGRVQDTALVCLSVRVCLSVVCARFWTCPGHGSCLSVCLCGSVCL